MIPRDRTTPPLAPIGMANRLFMRAQRALCVPLIRLPFRYAVHGPAPPDHGPLLVAANHESYLDPIVLQLAFRQRLHYLMTSDFYFKPLLNAYSRMMRCIPVLEDRLNREALRSALAVLDAGRAVGVFPQGGIRSEDDLGTGMRGIALLAVKSGAPVLPVRIRGTGRVLPRGARFVRLATISVHLGCPMNAADLLRKTFPSRHEHLEALTARIMDSIKAL